MKVISGKRMCQILDAKGWKLARVTGSHHIFIMPGKTIRISVPVHRNQDLKIGLQRAIMNLAGVQEEELQDRPLQAVVGTLSQQLPCVHQPPS